MPFLNARSLALAPGLLLVEDPGVTLKAAFDAMVEREGGGAGARGEVERTLAAQPDRLLQEIGYWDEHVGDGVEEGGGDGGERRTAQMYARVVPPTSNAEAVKERIAYRQSTSLKRDH